MKTLKERKKRKKNKRKKKDIREESRVALERRLGKTYVTCQPYLT